ncbi:PREDICTED: uncharacterized protein LOC105557007 [Vollenhovia emeryi]|uniref:uncharacterized protein LOC105557007 n=1 Tax=Vollenhovia emeryi TaxID=411798 RepID=UPI0005F4E03A|nr:PREDICTED: uncharacterized protein LOC105557007 [Vollenhovia emeryi]
MLHKTRLGWVLAGRYPMNHSKCRSVNNFHASVSNAELDNHLKEFWHLEDAQTLFSKPQSPDERRCSEHFAKNVARDASGRFVVKLPVIHEKLNSIGDSRATALRRFYSVKKRLNRDPKLKASYIQFMNEYAAGHMKPMREATETNGIPPYYLPHHPVIKGTNEAAKIRVVFDGSCKGSLGSSLNDALLIGPVVQQDLISIVIRFRTLRYVFCADIIKMYRQIVVHESQRHLQRIFWRADPLGKVLVYELTTVTYGTSSASFLATRCLTYLAELEAHNFPTGSKHVINDFYVDDCLSGADSLAHAKLIRDEIIALLQKGSFQLSKWASNSSELLEPDRHDTCRLIEFDKNPESRILGIRWNPTSDYFHFYVTANSLSNSVTKHPILSEVSRLFDPLGLLGPVIVIGKLIIQELWQLNVSWDETIPSTTHTKWSRLKNQLSILNDLQIPRLTKFTTSSKRLQIHGFCDASQIAYGACIYIRSEVSDRTYRTELLCSRSRVAPLKAVSLPRLELCSALLLAQLYEKVRSSIDISQIRSFMWSDSTIALHWISSCSRKWSVFVANRVGEIQRTNNIADWRHVSSENNPADILSRGAEPQAHLSSFLWWHGPEFLQHCESSWPPSNSQPLEADIPEQVKNVHVTVAALNCPINKLLNKFSDFNLICRIIAYCLRISEHHKSKYTCTSQLISAGEIQAALRALCVHVQGEAFSNELKSLRINGIIGSASNMLPLSPFLDSDGLIRVGGRLTNFQLPYSARHPIILPKHNRLTHFIVEFEHNRNLHAGVQGTIAAVRPPTCGPPCRGGGA